MSLFHPMTERPKVLAKNDRLCYIILADSDYASTALYNVETDRVSLVYSISTDDVVSFNWGSGSAYRWCYVADFLKLK